MFTHNKYPSMVNDVSFGSSGDGLSAILSFQKDTLRYVFENDVLNVWYNNTKSDTYSFDGSNMISENYKHPFEVSDVEHELNNFK
ncbi:hypothetical protein [Weissella koreensis]|uniref:hypothetical protein n=1 Tax=Weissella koreensis TaxID=165096 RepID=UPI0022BA1C8D|nr:hypothetical protein [Weissella koreensis]